MNPSQPTVEPLAPLEAPAAQQVPSSPGKRLSLRANFSWTFTGNVVYAASQWGMLVILAKLGSPEMVGLFALGLAISAPVILFANLQLRNVQATDVDQEYLFGDYLGTRFLTSTLALLAIVAIAFAIGGSASQASVIIAFGLAKAAESISDVFYGMFQHHERFDRIAKSLMIKGPLSLLVLGTLVYLTGSVLWGVVGLVFSWSITVAYDVYNGILILGPESGRTRRQGLRMMKPRWKIEKLRPLVLMTLPLGFTQLLTSLNPNIPRYFIQWTLGERSLGIFAAIAYLVVAGNTVVLALGQSAMPRLARHYSRGENAAFQSLLLKLVGIGLFLGGAGVLVALVAGRQVLTLIYSPEYAEQTDVFFWLMIAAALSYVQVFSSYAVMAVRYFKVQLPLYGVAVAVNAAICAWLIPAMGLRGAALALAVSWGVQSIGNFAVNWYALRHPSLPGGTLRAGSS